MTEKRSYSAQWRRLRLWGYAQWFIILAGIPVMFLLSFSGFDRAENIFVVCWMLSLLIVVMRYTLFRCPRCHKRFFMPKYFAYNTFLKACPHCRLPK